MKVIGEEQITRYHVEFTEAEARYLRSIGFLPPRVTHGQPALLWATHEELEQVRGLLNVDRFKP